MSSATVIRIAFRLQAQQQSPLHQRSKSDAQSGWAYKLVFNASFETEGLRAIGSIELQTANRGPLLMSMQTLTHLN